MTRGDITDAQILAFAGVDVQPDEYILQEDICTIGRATICQIVVAGRMVSRLHAKIERDGPRYVLHDAGSANGTFVNGHRLHESYVLKDGDIIGFGSAQPVVRFVDPDPTQQHIDRLRYDEHSLRFALDNRPLELSPGQFRLLLHLYQHANNLCTRESCAQAIWGREYDPGMDADTLDRAVNTLRARIRDIAPDNDLIRTRRGLGYELNL